MEDYGELSLEAILSEDEIAELETLNGTQGTPPEEKEEKNDIINTEDLTVNDLFGEDNPESVGDDDKDKGGKEKPKSTKAEDTTSPDNLYSSIAEALVDEGFFSDLADDVKNCQTAEDLMNLFKKHNQSMLDEEQKRVSQALNDGVEPSAISSMERTIKYLNSITKENVEDESDEGIKIRQQLIYNDYINKGFSKQRALDLVKRAFDNHTDIEDAKEALESNKTHFKNQYDSLLAEARKAKQEEEDAIKTRKENLKKSILNESKAFGEVDVDSKTRQRVFDVLTKPYYKDKETGEYMSELDKYEMEHPDEFDKYMAYFYVITNGFTSLDNVAKSVEKKVTKAGLKKLEQVVNSTQRNSDGSLRLVGGNRDNSYFNGDVSIDL